MTEFKDMPDDELNETPEFKELLKWAQGIDWKGIEEMFSDARPNISAEEVYASMARRKVLVTELPPENRANYQDYLKKNGITF